MSRYLDPKIIPKTPSQGVFGRLGSVVSGFGAELCQSDVQNVTGFVPLQTPQKSPMSWSCVRLTEATSEKGGGISFENTKIRRRQLRSLKLTFSHPKMDGWNKIVSFFWDGLFSGGCFQKYWYPQIIHLFIGYIGFSTIFTIHFRG